MQNEIESYGDGNDDDEDMTIIEEPNDDEVEREVPYMDLDDIRSDLADGYYPYETMDDAYLDEGWVPQRGVRGMSEEIGAVMDM